MALLTDNNTATLTDDHGNLLWDDDGPGEDLRVAPYGWGGGGFVDFDPPWPPPFDYAREDEEFLAIIQAFVECVDGTG